MSTDRDFDRIARAWLDLMPDQAPDRAVASVRQAVESTPQVRRRLHRGPWRFPAMHRFTLLAGAAALVVVIGGLAVLSSRGSLGVGAPTPIATTSPNPSPSPTPSTNAVPSELRGPWSASTPSGLASVASGSRIRLVIEGGSATIDTLAGDTLRSTISATLPNGFTLVSTNNSHGCTIGDTGRYRWESRGSSTLTLTSISDACSTRATVLGGGSWTRSFDAVDSPGQSATLTVDGFDPMFTVTMPAGQYTVDRSPDAITIGRDELTLLAVKDPQGFRDPCVVAGGRYDIAPGADPFVAYFQQLKGFTVVSTEQLQIDGHRAVHLVIDAKPDAVCPAGWLAEWQPKAETTGNDWHISPGDADSIYIVELPTATVLLQVLGGGYSWPDEMRVLSTVHFLDTTATNP